MDEMPLTPRQGITVTQNTAIRRAARTEIINPYVARTPAGRAEGGKPENQDKKGNSGGLTVTQETGIRKDKENESGIINAYVARAPVKPKSGTLHNPARFSVLDDAKGIIKDGLGSQDNIGTKTVAGYIALGEAGIKTWKLAQASAPVAVGSAKAAVKVVRGTLTVVKTIVVFSVTPIESAKELARKTKRAVIRAAARVKAKLAPAAAAAKKTFRVVRGVIKGTVALPPHIPQKIVVGIFKCLWYVGRISAKTAAVAAIKGGVKTVKIGGSLLVTAGNIIGRSDDMGAQAFGGTVTAGKYTVEAIKFSPKVVKGVYMAGKTTVMVPVRTVQGGVFAVKGVIKVVKSIRKNGWAKTAGKVWKKVRTAAVHAAKAIGNALKLLFKVIANKFVLPVLIIVIGFIVIFHVISVPVQAGGMFFSGIFSIFSPDTGSSAEMDITEYVSNAAAAARDEYIQNILDESAGNLKINGGAYDFVRLYIGGADGDQAADGMQVSLAAINANIFTVDELVNLAQPIFNAIVLTKYDLEPTETEAKNAVEEILSTLLRYETQAMKAEWCEYGADDPTDPDYCTCGNVHANIDCPDSASGYHSVWTCPRCDHFYDNVEVDDDGVAIHTTELYCSGYTYCKGHSILGISVIQDGWYALTYRHFTKRIEELLGQGTLTPDEENELHMLQDGYELALEYIKEKHLSFGDLTVSDLSGVNFLPGERPGNQGIPDYAMQFVGNVGGQPFWSWYGFKRREEWCGCFVSYVLAHCGMTDIRFASCEAGANWFKKHGQWYAGSGYAAVAGDIIFFDWENEGETHHVGIVIGHDGERVYTVEGNSANDMCRLKSYPINSTVIFGYGLPNY